MRSFVVPLELTVRLAKDDANGHNDLPELNKIQMSGLIDAS